MVELAMELLTFGNPIFACYAVWTVILAVKMLLMSLLTAYRRFTTKTFPNPEDLRLRSQDIQVRFDDPDVERVRRSHRNDLENILPYLIIALLYICTNPNRLVAINLFRIYGILRVAHTLVYAFVPVPQPTRAIIFFIAYGITCYMAAVIFFSYCEYI